MMNTMIISALSAALLSTNVVHGQNPSFNQILADPTRSFSTLVNAFAIANIDITNDVDVPLTIFAPTNDAFDKMNPAMLDSWLSDGWDAHLLNFLAMHLLPEARNFNSFTNGEIIPAVNDEEIIASVTTTPKRALTLASPNTLEAVVSLPRNASSDGVFYQINDVLLPAFASIDILTVTSAAEFSIFSELLVSCGLADLIAQGVVATVFVPTDDAFVALGADALDYYYTNSTATAFLLLGHVIPDTVVSTLPIESSPMEYTSGAGETLSFVGTLGTTDYSFTINEANLISPNVLALDGIVHVIDRVLEVAGANAPAPAPVAFPVARPVSSPVVLPPASSPTAVLSPPTSAPKRRMRVMDIGAMNGVKNVQQGRRMMNMKKRPGRVKKEVL
jgi:transforming growth factor-beta-induced protein